MLNMKVVSWALGVTTSISFLVCVSYGLATPASLHMTGFLEQILPGFKSSHYTHLLSISLACVTLRQIRLNIEQIFPIWIVLGHLRWDKPLAFLHQRRGQSSENSL